MIGFAQNVAQSYELPDMANHIHLRVKAGGEDVDPAPYFIGVGLQERFFGFAEPN